METVMDVVPTLIGQGSWVWPAVAGGFLCLAVASTVAAVLRPWSFTLWVIAAVATGFAFPGWFIGVGDFRFTSLFKPLLMLIMFCMGATLSIDDFRGVMRMPVGVAVGLVCQFTIMPLLGCAVATAFRFPPEVAAGIVLVGVAPSGLASNVMSYIARANVALSVTITAAASLLSPLATPLLMKRLAGQLIEIDAPAMMFDIAQMVLVPILAGLAFHHLSPALRRRIEPVLPLFSMAGIIAMTVLTVAVGRDNLLDVGPMLLLHIRSGYRGIDLARFFKVPKTTAYGWLDWFKSLPEGLREGILAFMDTQAPIMAACQLPVHVAKQNGPAGDAATKGGAASATGSPNHSAAG